MNRAAQRDVSSCPDLSVETPIRSLRGAAWTRAVEPWLLALLGLVGLVTVMLAGPSVTTRTPRPSARVPAALVEDTVAALGGPTTEAHRIPTDGDDQPADEERAKLDSETDDDDDDDEQQDVSAAAPRSRSVTVFDGRRTAWGSKPLADTGCSLVSTGLARGPPVAV